MFHPANFAENVSIAEFIEPKYVLGDRMVCSCVFRSQRGAENGHFLHILRKMTQDTFSWHFRNICHFLKLKSLKNVHSVTSRC